MGVFEKTGNSEHVGGAPNAAEEANVIHGQPSSAIMGNTEIAKRFLQKKLIPRE